jgi:23S rRNA (uracil1939-C5)-methyltransferase
VPEIANIRKKGYTPRQYVQHLPVPKARRLRFLWLELQQKLSEINGSFAIKELDLRVEEIFPAPKTEHYRNRMDFVINFKGEVGLREKGKWWKVIDDHTCFLGDEKIETLFPIVRTWVKESGLSFFDRKANIGTLRYAVIRATSTGETMIIIVTSAPNGENQLGEKNEATLVDFNDDAAKIESALADLAKKAGATTVVWSINHTISDLSFGDELRVIDGPGTIEESIEGVRFRISPNAFFQTNSYAAPMLLSTVREFAGNLSDKTLLDLYCGTGFFGIALAGEAKKTIGVELVADAIKDARVNAELNGFIPTADCSLPPIEFFDAKTEAYDWMKLGADVVILDPPRSGMHDKALADVIAAKPERIIYISCNFKNFAREMVLLSEHYDVEAIRAVDMFPHTPHVELVTALVKKPIS